MSVRVAMAGASGAVGSHALSCLLERDDVARVIAVGRRPLPVEHTKLEAPVADFGRTESLSAALPDGLDAGVCALGTTMKKAGSRDAFRAVDHDAVLAFAEAVRFRGARSFAVVSSIGAGLEAWSFYLRVKGQTEAGLREMGFDHLSILRPSLLDDAGARHETRLGERLALAVSRPIFSVLGPEGRYAPIQAETVGRALVRLALDEPPATDAPDTRAPDGTAVRIVESDELHRVGARTGSAAGR